MKRVKRLLSSSLCFGSTKRKWCSTPGDGEELSMNDTVTKYGRAMTIGNYVRTGFRKPQDEIEALPISFLHCCRAMENETDIT